MSWRNILDNHLSSGDRLTPEEAVILYRDAPLQSIRRAANQRRIEINGNEEVTYLIDRNINYTNVCTINCQFCSFYRPPGHEENYTQSVEEISQRVKELEAIGGSSAIVPSEGVVFKYKGNIYKFTGAFAPVNQILGSLRF